MKKNKTIEEDLEEAAYRAREHLIDNQYNTHSVDPDFDGQEEFQWESIGDLSKKVVEEVGQK